MPRRAHPELVGGDAKDALWVFKRRQLKAKLITFL
jgi:hypothetical protein